MKINQLVNLHLNMQTNQTHHVQCVCTTQNNDPLVAHNRATHVISTRGLKTSTQRSTKSKRHQSYILMQQKLIKTKSTQLDNIQINHNNTSYTSNSSQPSSNSAPSQSNRKHNSNGASLIKSLRTYAAIEPVLEQARNSRSSFTTIEKLDNQQETSCPIKRVSA